MDDDVLSKLIDGAFDFMCERRISELIDVERVLAVLDAGAPHLSLMMQRLVAPARERILKRLQKSDRLLGVWLPEPVKDALAQLLGTPMKIPKKWIDQAVTDERVRDQVRQAMQDALSSAVKAAPGGRGLKGMIGLAGAAGRGLFGGIGEEIQRQIEERLKDLVDSGVSLLQQRVAQKLASDETAQQLGRRRRRMFLDMMKQPESELGRTLELRHLRGWEQLRERPVRRPERVHLPEVPQEPDVRRRCRRKTLPLRQLPDLLNPAPVR